MMEDLNVKMYRRGLQHEVKTSINTVISVMEGGVNKANDIYKSVVKAKDINKEELDKLVKSYKETYGDFYSYVDNNKYDEYRVNRVIKHNQSLIGLSEEEAKKAELKFNNKDKKIKKLGMDLESLEKYALEREKALEKLGTKEGEEKLLRDIKKEVTSILNNDISGGYRNVEEKTLKGVYECHLNKEWKKENSVERILTYVLFKEDWRHLTVEELKPYVREVLKGLKEQIKGL